LVSQDTLKTTREDQKSKTVHHSPRENLKNAITHHQSGLEPATQILTNYKDFRTKFLGFL
jgi:hypothetical protein